MRRLLLLLFASIALTAAAPGVTATITVVISKAGIVPADVTVKQGDTVTWTNSDAVAHQIVVKNYNCSLTIQPGQQGSCTFSQSGKFNYSDPTQTGNKFKGSITVQAGPTSVTLQSSKKILIFGGAATLSGAVSTAQAGERVTILAQPCGQTAFSQLTSLSTTTGGAFSYVVKPTLNTNFQAKWKAAAATVTVKVRPRVRLTRLAAGRFSVSVTAAMPFTGRYVVFQRYSAPLTRWVSVKRVYLRATTGAAPLVVTSASFRAKVKSRLRVRAFMPQAQVGACYVAGIGNVIRS
ncbi:MAG: cupredoxin domain-containing protein [Thermoleophilia bacterium]